MSEFDTTDVEFDTDTDEAGSSKVAIVALAGTLVVAAGAYGVMKLRKLRKSKVETTTEDIIELPPEPPSSEE